MTTATLTTSTLASAPSSDPIGLALKQLGVAALNLTRALWTALATSFTWERREQTPQESAQALRVFASSIAASDPRFASDLFAAADRHEFGDNA
jgi:hypothetical protein